MVEINESLRARDFISGNGSKNKQTNERITVNEVKKIVPESAELFINHCQNSYRRTNKLNLPIGPCEKAKILTTKTVKNFSLKRMGYLA